MNRKPSAAKEPEVKPSDSSQPNQLEDDWDVFLTRIEQTDLELRVLGRLMESLHDQQASDLDALEKHTRPIPKWFDVIVADSLRRRQTRSRGKKAISLRYENIAIPCKHAYELFTKLCREVLRNRPDQWHKVVTRLNSGCRTNLLLAQSREELFPHYSDYLRREKAAPIGDRENPWFVSKVGLDATRIIGLVKLLCEVVELEFGRDVVLLGYDQD